MHDPRPRRHEKSSRDLTGKAENSNIIEFPASRKAASPSDEIFGIEEHELSTNEQFQNKPKLELLPPEKILLGFAVVVAAIILGVLLLLLITWPT